MEVEPGQAAGTTRRGFLRLVGTGAALAAVARVPSSAAAKPRGSTGARFFDAEQSEILTQVVERMVDSGEPDAPRVRDTRAIATIDALCASLDPAITGPLPLLLRLVDWGPVLFDWRFARFTRLPAEDQDASLRGWMTSRLGLRRLGFLALKNLAMLGWYAQEESWPALGYAGPLLQRRGAP